VLPADGSKPELGVKRGDGIDLTFRHADKSGYLAHGLFVKVAEFPLNLL